MTTAFVSLGSNSQNANSMLKDARDRIAFLPGVAVAAASQTYSTEPQGFAAQPWFANQVLKLEATHEWSATKLLASFLHIEAMLGRSRVGPRFGPRCIDIDLLLFGSLQCSEEGCVVPHPRMTQRAFVLLPLMELEPDIVIGNRTANQWLARLNWKLDGNKIFQSE